MLFKKKPIDPQELDYESQLAYEILGDSDYRIFKRCMSFVGYSSPGEYIRAGYEDVKMMMDCPAKLSEGITEKKRRAFYNDGFFFKPIIKQFQDFYLQGNYNRLNDKLQYSLLTLEFSDPDISIPELESRIVQYENLCVFIERQGGNNWHYLSHMKMLLDKRKSGHLVESVVEDDNQDGVSLNYQFYLPSLRNFKKFAVLLEENGLIDSSEKLISMFIFPDQTLQEKIVWDRSLVALIFLVEFLTHHGVIAKPKNYRMSLAMNFKGKDIGDLTNNSLGATRGKAKFKKDDFDPYKTNNQRDDVIEIKKLYKRVNSG